MGMSPLGCALPLERYAAKTSEKLQPGHCDFAGRTPTAGKSSHRCKPLCGVEARNPVIHANRDGSESLTVCSWANADKSGP